MKLRVELADLKQEQLQLEQRLDVEKEQENTTSFKINEAKQEQDKVKERIALIDSLRFLLIFTVSNNTLFTGCFFPSVA